MLAVLLNWCYMIVTTFCLGFGAVEAAERKLHTRITQPDSILAVGLVLATVYAQVWSLFSGVGIGANVILVICCMLIVLGYRRRFLDRLKQLFEGSTLRKGILLLVLVFVWAFCTSRGYMHYDSDLYHAQSIRWIEEYGVVRGLGNIHVRFAYNSSFFALSALYSMPEIAGQSLHCVNGFMALILSVEAFKISRAWTRGKLLPSDYARVAALYYLTLIYGEVTSPASDYAIMCTVFFLVIKWLALAETETASEYTGHYALLCVGGVFAVSLKLTAGVILLLVLKPAVRLVRAGRWKEILVYLALGLAVLVPWLARTVIISGYLLYPFPALDLFAVDWKIPASAAALDAAEIKTWGRGLNNAALVEMPIWQWFPQWFQTMLPALGKLLILSDWFCLVAGFLFAVTIFIRKKYTNRCLLVWIAVAASFLFWQCSAPLLRYGYAYVLLLTAVTVGMILDIGMEHTFNRNNIAWNRMLCLLLLGLGMVKLFSFARYTAGCYRQPFYLKQKDYGTYDLEYFSVEGITFYYPVSGDQTGYDAFPAVPRKVEIILRGEGLREGFCQQE